MFYGIWCQCPLHPSALAIFRWGHRSGLLSPHPQLPPASPLTAVFLPPPYTRPCPSASCAESCPFMCLGAQGSGASPLLPALCSSVTPGWRCSGGCTGARDSDQSLPSARQASAETWGDLSGLGHSSMSPTIPESCGSTVQRLPGRRETEVTSVVSCPAHVPTGREPPSQCCHS